MWVLFWIFFYERHKFYVSKIYLSSYFVAEQINTSKLETECSVQSIVLLTASNYKCEGGNKTNYFSHLVLATLPSSLKNNTSRSLILKVDRLQEMYENYINDKIFRYCLNMQQNIGKCWRSKELVCFDSAEFDSTTLFCSTSRKLNVCLWNLGAF